MSDILPDEPFVSEGTKRFLAKQAAVEAARVAEVARKAARDQTVFDAIRRTAWCAMIGLALLHGPALAHDWFHTLIIPGSESVMPGGISCCDNRDCAPAHARVGPMGWEAETPTGVWVPVPAARVIHDKSHPSGSAVLCWRPESGVVCFVLPAAAG